MLNVQVFNQQTKFAISLKSVKNVVANLCAFFAISCETCIVRFVTPRKSAALHAKYFQDSTITDCMTFPIDDPFAKPCEILGEIVINPQAAFDYATKKKISFTKELTRYLVHGFLHLLGENDLSAQERKKMRSKENGCLKKLALRRCYIDAKPKRV